MSEVEEALASIQADYEWAHGVLRDEIALRGNILSECARLIPIALPLPERIRFVLEMKANLAKEVERLTALMAALPPEEEPRDFRERGMP